MKILQVSNLFSPRHGGSAEVPYRLSRELVKRGHQVTIYTSDYQLKKDKLPPLDGIRFHAFKTWANVAGLQKTPGVLLRARREVKGMDVIHLHNLRTFQNIALHHYARKHGVPYALQAHGSLPRIMSKKALKQAFDICWGKTLLRDAAGVIAVTPIEMQQYLDAGASQEKIHVIPHGVDTEEFASLPPKGTFKHKYGIAADQKIVLYLGRLHKIKGLDLLVKAFAELRKTLPNVILVIAGPDDGYFKELNNLVATLKLGDKVIFAEALYEQDKLSAYVDADIYVLPSTYEIFGITVLEALACGTPVIVTDRCGLADTIKDRAGLVVGYDQKQLGDALQRLLADDKLRSELGEKGKTLARDEFNWENIAAEVEKLYQEILS
ncbi:glycosyltransferase [Chloroflexota bacterium]